MSVVELLLLAVGSIGCAVGALLLVAAALTTRQRRVSRSLAAIGAGRAPVRGASRELDQPFGERVVDPAMRRLTALGRRFSRADQAAAIRRRLDIAGNPPLWDVDRVIAFKMLGLMFGAVVGALAALALSRSPLTLVGSALVLGIAGYFFPNVVIYQQGYTRTEQMRRDLSDALDLLSISVEAGLTFDAALAQVARNTKGPLAEELSRVLQEMQIGLGRADAMRAMGERTDLAELRGFVTAMVQAESFGIPTARVLRVQARELRVKRSQRAEEQAQKVPVKILFPLIFCIMPCLFIVVMGPAAINIAHTFVGR